MFRNNVLNKSDNNTKFRKMLETIKDVFPTVFYESDENQAIF